MEDVLHVPVSRGYVTKLCTGIVSDSLAEAYEELKDAIPQQEQLLDRSRRLFSAWHRRDEMTDEGFHRSMLTHRDRFLEVVRNPPSTKEAKNLAAQFAIVEYSTDDSKENYAYDMLQDYFCFMFAEGRERLRKAFVTSAGANPTLTGTAIADREAHCILTLAKKGYNEFDANRTISSFTRNNPSLVAALVNRA